jgi:starch synthase
MKIAIVASEAAPFAKTGGLADVAGALPKALAALGHEPVLIMPLYRSVRANGALLGEVARIAVPLHGRTVQARVMRGEVPGSRAPVLFLEHEAYYDRERLYNCGGEDYLDNCERFAFLSRGAIEATLALGFDAEVFHLHDWQTALVAPYLRLLYDDDEVLRRAGTVLTVHNMAHQGIFWHWDMKLIGIDWRHYNPREFEFWGKMSLLKAGMVYADALSTVSPTYAREILQPEFGYGLSGVVDDRREVLHGVVNGIDEKVWDPATDAWLPARYSAGAPAGKATCKRALLRRAGLPQSKAPLAGIVSRFAYQKGLDLAAHALPQVMEKHGLQCVVLGDGDDGVRRMFEGLAARHPDRLRVFTGLDEKLAHLITAGADLVLVPSRYEPCGLTQLYGLRYGSVPVVRATGGLADTVTDCTPETLAAGTATGFSFAEATTESLAQALDRACALYRNAASWRRLVRAGMEQDWSWDASARRYLDLYAEARARRETA